MKPDDKPTDDQLSHSQVANGGWRAGWRRVRTALHVAQVRLRFVIVFAVAFLVVGNWETLRNYWDRLVTISAGSAPQAVSGNTEYFCPMCPGVISDWPAKCPVCNMALVRRKKGGPVQLPDGVVSRMQYSPYRLQLAGIRTSVASYRPLAREVVASAFARAASTADEPPGGNSTVLSAAFTLPQQDAAMLRAGQDGEVTCISRPGQGPWKGRVRTVQFEAPQTPMSTVVVKIDDPRRELSAGMEVSATFQLPIADVEPFSSQPAGPAPLTPSEPRSVFICPDHADVLGDKGSKCPRDGLALVARPLAENERVRYWCPMHPHVTADEPGRICDECQGMILQPRVVVYRPYGEVLTVPEDAVINTGNCHMVYVDRGAGMFDGVEVVVGPRAEGYYSIVGGLQAGQTVASAGAFLLDAETRLNPNTSAAYFGATTNSVSANAAPQASVREDVAPANDAAKQAEIEAALSELPAEDERLARRQKVCPVTQLALGSMGKPEKILVQGRGVFICCAGCKAALLGDPEKYLAPEPAADEASEQP